MAEPKAGQALPDRLTLGHVRVGATVEASLIVYENGVDTAGVECQVKPPPFLRVKQACLETRDYGPAGKFIACDIAVSVKTESAGRYSAPLAVQIGTQRVEIPVTVDVSPVKVNDTRLLVVETPFHRYSTGDATLFAPWLELVKSGSFDVHYLDVQRHQPVLRDLDLSAFDVVLLGDAGLVFLQQADMAKLRKFVVDGGRLILMANHFFQGTVDMANVFLLPRSVKMADEEARDVQLFEVRVTGIAEHPLTKGVQTLRFHRPSPITITDDAKAKILVAASDDNPREGFVAIAQSGEGEIVAVGVSLWWNWIASEHEKGLDNAVLLKNLLTKPRNEK